ncbi:MAG: hypothetical protein DMF86_09580 [Acidobacteria bacterium]|nr:MAG: hypothetical protein DMF86_09580 [Acidobacteriota bacterium]
MSDVVQIVAIVVSTALLLAVIDLVRRRRLREEYAFVWLVGAAALVVLSIWRNSLNIAANWLGVYYPPAVLLLGVILAVFVVSLYFAVVISKQRRQIDRLVEELALLEAEVRGLQSAAVPASEVIERPAADRGDARQERHLR